MVIFAPISFCDHDKGGRRKCWAAGREKMGAMGAMGGLGAMGGDDMDRKASNGFCCHMKYAPNDSVEITTNL